MKFESYLIFDTELIYSRTIGLIPSRKLDKKDLFRYELSPVPTSMLDDNGDMKITKSKSVLKQKLQVSYSTRSSQPQVVIIDGSAMQWVIKWPINGNVQDFVNGYINYIMKLFNECDVYLVFDRNYEYTAKCVTRSGRAGKASSKKHKITPTMLLTTQKILLNCTANKVQLIDIICEQVIEISINVQPLCRSFKNRRIVTGSNLIP